MFTGIVTDIGTIRHMEQRGDTYYQVATAYNVEDIDIGASIAHSGVCLTVVDKGRDDDGNWFGVEASRETLDVTTAQHWRVGTRLNLERALQMGDELGGHIVSGHVDGIATVENIRSEGDSKRFTFAAPPDLAGFIASKGSVTLDGTSLTVNEVDGAQFGVNLIAHTQNVTTWGATQIGDAINLEIDVLARYVARLAETLKHG
ncbi:MAG: riboflavin synthase [Parvibaculales bacterium]